MVELCSLILGCKHAENTCTREKQETCEHSPTRKKPDFRTGEKTMKEEIKFAKKQIINATWVLKYIQVTAEKIRILQYARDDRYYGKEYPTCSLVEAETAETNRCVTHARIDDYAYEVENKGHVFSYNPHEPVEGGV